ncbi:MAG: hypothetical protein HY899_15625 [Deltaproteobacteria bacterium]|nr:hypothetical protein [Deltaproteobacteria bacterium]
MAASAGEEDILAVPASSQDQRGLELAGGRLWVSAFVNVAFESLKGHPEEVNLDDLGVLARWDPYARLSLFTALELEDFLGWADGDGVFFAEKGPAIERLYADVSVSSSTTLRLGKILTPFGIWNPIRRAPLTWTVDRPLVTEVSFPLHLTGLMLDYKATPGDWSIDTNLYGQPGGELDRFSDEKAAKRSLGGRVAFGHALPSGFATAGVQAAWFEDVQSDDEEYAAGVDLDLSVAGQLVTSEVILSDGEVDDYETRWGAYLQLVSPIWRGLFGVVRGEIVDLRRSEDYRNLVLGLAWRSENDRWVLKLNYQFSGHEVDGRSDGVGVAVSSLF